jgi:hypothetical protein
MTSKLPYLFLPCEVTLACTRTLFIDSILTIGLWRGVFKGVEDSRRLPALAPWREPPEKAVRVARLKGVEG